MGRGKKGLGLFDLIFGTGGKRKTIKGTSKEGRSHIGVRNGGNTNKSAGVGYTVGGKEYYRPPREK